MHPQLYGDVRPESELYEILGFAKSEEDQLEEAAKDYDQLDDETIDKLVIVFKRAMAKMATAIRETKAIETLKSMENFNKQKAEQEKKDAKTLKDLDSKLKNL